MITIAIVTVVSNFNDRINLMEHEKKNWFSTFIDYSRTIVIVGAITLIISSLALIAYKIYRATRIVSDQQEEIITEEPKQHNNKPIATKIKNTDSIAAIRLAELFVKYFTKDTVPKILPEYLEEAAMGFEFGDFGYFETIDLTNIQITAKTDSIKKQEILLLGHYYKALSFLHKSNLPEAIANFNWLLNINLKEPYLTKVNWYLAMTHLKTNNPNLVKRLLENVAQSNNAAYSNKAKLLLIDIEILNLPNG